jgi:predicted SprT family Zn-dependent metalloprotease
METISEIKKQIELLQKKLEQLELKKETKLEYTERMLNHYMEKHGLLKKGWKYKFGKATCYAGVTCFKTKVINLSLIFINSQSVNKDVIKNVILHEIAHSLVGHSHGHDKVWKEKAIEIGCCGSRCCESFASDEHYKYILNCPKGCKLRRQRLTKRLDRCVCKKHNLKFQKI